MHKKLLVFLSLLIFGHNRMQAQFYVHLKPVFSPHIVVRAGVPPFAGAIWMGPEWVWNTARGCYIEVPGYWVRARPGWIWRPGHWRQTDHGWTWIPGRWQRF
jgi:hypothetical protein